MGTVGITSAAIGVILIVALVLLVRRSILPEWVTGQVSEQSRKPSQLIQLVLLSLLWIVCLLSTLYFHFSLRQQVIVSHLFYLPIVIASFWWQRWGILLAVSSGAFLLLSHHFASLGSLTDDIVRSCSFVVVSVTIAWLSEKTAQATTRIRESEALLRSVFDGIQDVFYRTDAEGRVILISPSVQRATGYTAEEVIGQPATMFYVDSAQRDILLEELSQKDTVTDFEIDLRHSDGTVIPTSVTCYIMKDDEGRVLGVEGVLRDITERRRAEAALREEKDRAQKYLDVAGVILAVVDADEKISLMNNKGCEVLGYSEREVIGQNWFDLLVPESCREEVRGVFRQLMAGQIEPVEYYENALLTKDGQERIIAFHNTVLTDEDGSIRAALCSGEDVTERKEAERQLHIYQQRLRALATRLSSVEEQERRAIAAGLHDDISQTLALCKMRMARLDESSPPSDVASISGEVRGLLDEAINRTRSLTFQLSPPVLYELGFVAAMEWLAEQLEEEHGVVINIEQDSQLPPIDDEVSIVLFRAVRELLINVVKHAQTNTARVCIDGNGDQVRVVVQDEGVGFDIAQLDFPGRPPGFGLFDIRERLDYIGGSLQIESQPGAGTRVAVIVPLKLLGQAATDKE